MNVGDETGGRGLFTIETMNKELWKQTDRVERKAERLYRPSGKTFETRLRGGGELVESDYSRLPRCRMSLPSFEIGPSMLGARRKIEASSGVKWRAKMKSATTSIIFDREYVDEADCWGVLPRMRRNHCRPLDHLPFHLNRPGATNNRRSQKR
nr:hypothetical protein CFP56_60705 [Quercus suber]